MATIRSRVLAYFRRSGISDATRCSQATGLSQQQVCTAVAGLEAQDLLYRSVLFGHGGGGSPDLIKATTTAERKKVARDGGREGWITVNQNRKTKGKRAT